MHSCPCALGCDAAPLGLVPLGTVGAARNGRRAAQHSRSRVGHLPEACGQIDGVSLPDDFQILVVTLRSIPAVIKGPYVRIMAGVLLGAISQACVAGATPQSQELAKNRA